MTQSVCEDALGYGNAGAARVLMTKVAGVWRCRGYGVSRNDRGGWRVALLRIVSENCCGGRKYRSSLKLLYCCDDLSYEYVSKIVVF